MQSSPPNPIDVTFWLQEQQRRATLTALGILPLVSRFDPPGAKAAVRLQAPAPVPHQAPKAELGEDSVSGGSPRPKGEKSVALERGRSAGNAPLNELRAQLSRAPSKSASPRVNSGSSLGQDGVPSMSDSVAEQTSPAPAKPATQPQQSAETAVSFSLLMVTAGRWLWLEALEDGLIRQEQLQLIQAMARALDGPGVDVSRRQLDWPLSKHPHLPQDIEAARQTVAGQVQRLAQEFKIAGVMVLGAATVSYLKAVAGLELIELPSTLAMLREPELKAHAWAAMRPKLAAG